MEHLKTYDLKVSQLHENFLSDEERKFLIDTMMNMVLNIDDHYPPSFKINFLHERNDYGLIRLYHAQTFL